MFDIYAIFLVGLLFTESIKFIKIVDSPPHEVLQRSSLAFFLKFVHAIGNYLIYKVHNYIVHTYKNAMIYTYFYKYKSNIFRNGNMI